MNWTRENYGQYLVTGECRASIRLFYDRNTRRDAITATITTPIFPQLEQVDFRTTADAKAWCEQWMAFATELVELRQMVSNLRAQRQRDFAEITALRNELHDYQYPRAAESEVAG
jgi:hypothetical protein